MVVTMVVTNDHELDHGGHHGGHHGGQMVVRWATQNRVERCRGEDARPTSLLQTGFVCKILHLQFTIYITVNLP